MKVKSKAVAKEAQAPSTAKLTSKEKGRLAGYLAQQQYHEVEAAKLRGIVRDLVAGIAERAGLPGTEFELDGVSWEIRAR
jgi:hypothetical protein